MAIFVVCYDSTTGGFRIQQVGSAQISAGGVLSGNIGAGVIGGPLLQDYGILSGKHASGAIWTEDIAFGAVTSAKIASGYTANVGGAVADNSITSAKIASGAVGADKLWIDGVWSGYLQSGAVIGDVIAFGAVLSGHIGTNVIATPHILNQGILSASIGAGIIGTPHLAALAIVSGKVASGGLSPLSSGKIWVGGAGNIASEQDPIATPLATAWKGSFNWDTSVYTNTEIDISALFSTNLALTTRRKYSVYLDLTNVAADASFVSAYIAIKTKVDGTNYRAIDRKTILDADIGAAAEPGIIIGIPAVAENVQITLQMSTALGADATIYYAVVKEHLE